MIKKTPTMYLKPSGYKVSNYYAQKPIGTDGNISFTRSTVGNRTNKNGLLEEVAINTPRLDWNNRTCPSLIFENGVTNEFDYSETFTNAYWTKRFATVHSLSATDPKGTSTAYRLQSTNVGGSHSISRTTALQTTNKTLSIFLKAGSIRYAMIGNISLSRYVHFDLLKGESVGWSGSTKLDHRIEKFNDGWFRYTVFHLGAGANENWGVTMSKDGQSLTFFGDTSDYIYIFGAMSVGLINEQSYISTNGSPVARTIDSSGIIPLKQGLETLDPNNFSCVVDVEFKKIGNGLETSLGISDNAFTLNRLDFTFDSSAETVLVRSTIGGTQDWIVSDIPTRQGKIKIGIRSNDTGFDVFVDGVLYDSPVGSVSGSALKYLHLYKFFGNTDYFHGLINKIGFWESRLTDNEMKYLTKI